MSNLWLIAILLITITNCQETDFQNKIDQGLSIQIIEPKRIAEVYHNHSIDYTIANFGVIPYDTQLIGHMVFAQQSDACSNITNNYENAPIIMADRGNCTFTQKAHNAQMAGAKLLIVIDNVFESENTIEIIGDGMNQDVTIPTIMLEKNDGKQLLHQLQQEQQRDNKNILVLKVSYPKLVHNQHSHVEAWVQSSDLRSMRTASLLLESYQKDFKQDTQVDLQLHYVSYVCAYCKAVDFRTNNEDCVSGGRYCAPDPDFMGPLTGRDVILENIKQMCLYHKNHQIYLTYLQQYTQECFFNQVYVKDWKECVKRIEQKQGIDETQCTYSGFMDTTDLNAGDNNILRQERELYQKRNLHSFPEVIINGVKYRGNLQGIAINNAICESFQEDNIPSHCFNFSTKLSPQQTMHYSFILYLLIGLVVMTACLLCYRRIMRREMAKEMQLQVNSAISQYYALNDKNGSTQSLDVKTI